MPNLTVTLSDAQWAAYQGVSSNPSLTDVSAWLKRQLVVDYQFKLEGVDSGTATSTESAAKSTRDTKLIAFEA